MDRDIEVHKVVLQQLGVHIGRCPMDEETITKTAIDYLLNQGRSFEVSLLLRARIEVGRSVSEFIADGHPFLEVTLLVPANMLDFYRKALTDERSRAIEEAYAEACWGCGEEIWAVRIGVPLAPSKPYPGWQEAVLSSISGDNEPLNQGTVATTSAGFSWNGLRFRSRTEAVLAAAFAKAKVLFFPLPAAVYEMRKLEPDFLVCAEGKWGILEVHGETYHTEQTAARESERRRWFLQRGVRVVEFYDATRCYKDPDGVVQEFLSILERS